MVTEVNMNVATYIKFDAISNALVEVEPIARPTKLMPDFFSADNNDPQLKAPATRIRVGQLDTSFDVHMTLGNALDQLLQASNAGQQQATASQATQSLFATPTLGKSSCPSQGFCKRQL